MYRSGGDDGDILIPISRFVARSPPALCGEYCIVFII